MGTKEPQKESPGAGIVEMVILAVVVFLSIFVSYKAGTRAVGIAMIFGAAWQQLKGRIPYGWEGAEPSGFLKGGLALAFNLIMAILGFSVVIWPEVAIGVLGWSGN